MASFTDTFERKEVKYRLNAKQHRYVLDALAGRMAEDEYGRSRITSLYFDTPTRDLIARSLEKPLYKEKLRVRWYGQPARAGRVYVEIKKKYDGIVYKRRVGCSQAAAMAYLTGGVPYENACAANPLSDQAQQEESLTLHSIQIAREIDAFVGRYRNLRPSMYIVCERTAFAPVPGGGAEGLRVTFDSGVAYRDAMAAGRHADAQFHPLLGLGEVIMEVKTCGAFPSWLVEALNGCEAFPSSFSKYGAAYEAVERAAGVDRAAAVARDGASAASAHHARRDGWRGASPAADAARAHRELQAAGASARLRAQSFASGGRSHVASQTVSAGQSHASRVDSSISPAAASSSRDRFALQDTVAIDRLSPAHDNAARRVSAVAARPARGLAALLSRRAS